MLDDWGVIEFVVYTLAAGCAWMICFRERELGWEENIAENVEEMKKEQIYNSLCITIVFRLKLLSTS